MESRIILVRKCLDQLGSIVCWNSWICSVLDQNTRHFGISSFVLIRIDHPVSQIHLAQWMEGVEFDSPTALEQLIQNVRNTLIRRQLDVVQIGIIRVRISTFIERLPSELDVTLENGPSKRCPVVGHFCRTLSYANRGCWNIHFRMRIFWEAGGL